MSALPYSHLGAEREIIQQVAYEPMVILMAIGMYQVTGSFKVAVIAQYQAPLILYLPGVFAGFLYILTIKFRKSPFDLSMSHHAHQEIVRGMTTEFSGPTLALIEIVHWYENVMLLGMVYLFFARGMTKGRKYAMLANVLTPDLFFTRTAKRNERINITGTTIRRMNPVLARDSQKTLSVTIRYA